MKPIIISVVFVAVLIGGVVLFKNGSFELSKNTPTNSVAQPADVTPPPIVLKGDTIPIQGKDHINVGDERDPYNSNPPTSGSMAGALPWGFNEKEIADENAVHNLEHGGIWVSYKNLDARAIDTLREIARANPQSVLVSPREENDSFVSVASWGRLLKLDAVGKEEIDAFIKNNINSSPEKLAR